MKFFLSALSFYLGLTTLVVATALTSYAWAQDNGAAESSQKEEKSAASETEPSAGESPTQESSKKPLRLSGKIPRPRNPSSEDASIQLLADDLPKDALLWLDAEGERFLSIWQKDRSGYPKGALLIIHAEGEHPAWPNTTKPLHDTLPDYGWATLAVSLPSPSKPEIPKRTLPVKIKRTIIDQTENKNEEVADKDESATETTDPQAKEKDIAVKNKQASTPVMNEEPDTAETKASVEEVTEKRLEAAFRFLHDQGQFNLIILGSGSGAIQAHDFLEKITPKIDDPRLKATFERPVRAMVIVNGKNQLPTMEENYSDWFSDPGIPILDIFVTGGYGSKQDAEYRKMLARQKKIAVYKQVRLTSLSQEKSWKENNLSRRVRSFLDTNAVGIEVKNAKIRRYN